MDSNLQREAEKTLLKGNSIYNNPEVLQSQMTNYFDSQSFNFTTKNNSKTVNQESENTPNKLKKHEFTSVDRFNSNETKLDSGQPRSSIHMGFEKLGDSCLEESDKKSSQDDLLAFSSKQSQPEIIEEYNSAGKFCLLLN